MTTIAQGSSAVVTVTSSSTIGLNSAPGDRAYIEATSGVPGSTNKVRLANHKGGFAVYGPFGVGAVTIYAVSGGIDYVSSDPAVSPDAKNPVSASPDGSLSAGGAPLPNTRGRRSTGRRTILPFGNSISAFSTNILVTGTLYNNVDAKSGSFTITLKAADGDLTGTFTAASKIVIQLHSGELFKTTVASSAFSTVTTITLTEKLPKLCRGNASATVAKYTTAGPTGITRDIGEVNAAVALLGGDIDVINGYGYGNSLSTEQLPDFSKWLRALGPDYTFLRLFENDIPSASTITRMQEVAQMFAEVAIGNGVIPIFGSPYPNSSVNTAPKCAIWDSMRDWMLSSLPILVPGAVVINTSTWLDPANIATSRAPLSTVASDGLHPDPSSRFYIGSLVAPQLPTAFINGDYSLVRLLTRSTNPSMTGTGGAATSAGGATTPTGSIAASWTVQTDGTGTAVACAKNADDSQNLQFSVTGTANISTTTAMIRQTITLATNSGSYQGLRPVFKVKINSLTTISSISAVFAFSGGEQYNTTLAAVLDNTNFSPLVGKTFVLEGPCAEIPDGSTTVSLRLLIKPITGSTTAALNIDVYEGLAVSDSAPSLVV